jgi:hypothetical protein
VLETILLWRVADSLPTFIRSPGPGSGQSTSVADAHALGAGANMLAGIAHRIEKLFMIVPVKPVSFWLVRIAAPGSLAVNYFIN